MIDTRKTLLVLESADVKSEYVTPMMPSEPIEPEQTPPLTSKENLTPVVPRCLPSLPPNKECLPRAQVDEWSRFRS